MKRVWFMDKVRERGGYPYGPLPIRFIIHGVTAIVLLFIFFRLYSSVSLSVSPTSTFTEGQSGSKLDEAFTTIVQLKELKKYENQLFNPKTTWHQLDPQLLRYIKTRHLFPPSTTMYNLNAPVNPIDVNVEAALLTVFPKGLGSEVGFFVECGANEGEFLSETIVLEKTFSWTGVLVEASPSLFKELKSKNRKAWISDICLSGARPEKIEFVRHQDKLTPFRTGNGRINPDKYYTEPSIVKAGWEREQYISEGLVECFPLFSLVSALNVSTIHYFSLDVEGHELTILKGIPFDKIDIKVIKVEHGMHTQKDKQGIHDLLVKNKYKVFFETPTDFIFLKL